MEIENSEMGNNSGGGGENHQVNSRWNPTKEQINILENMYMEGIRTPSADQIQQITARLKAYGEIEGKNVFSWFQNHKARQRQKLKQENFESISRYLYKSNHQYPMFVPPPSPNGVCGTYYLPQGEIGIYPQYPKVLIPCTGVKRRHRSERFLSYGSAGSYDQLVLPYNNYPIEQPVETRNCRGKIQETLPLFPLHPTGNIINVEEKEGTVFSSNSASESMNATTPSSSSESTINGVDEGSNNKPFFDFFSRPRQVPFESA